MNTKKFPVPLSAQDYRVLTKSKMIAIMFADQFETAKKRGEGWVLSLTRNQLEELTGWVDGESRTAHSRRIGGELGQIRDHLQAVLADVKQAGG